MKLSPSRLLLPLYFVAFISASTHADWLLLKDGARLRGIDAKKKGKYYHFTLENGHEIAVLTSKVAGIEKSPNGEAVTFRGDRVTLAQKARTLRKEKKAREKKLRKDIETWARGKKSAAAAKARVKALPKEERAQLFSQALLLSRLKSARLLAARELIACDEDTSVPTLALGAVKDSYRSVRDACLRSLKFFEKSDVSGEFLPHLSSSSPQRRLRAANALSVFPARKAVPHLLGTMRLTYSGFGRGFFVQVTQRAYIADYELVSGGTGFSIVEVADPIVRTSQTGVALDVQVRKVEVVARLRALVRSSGEDFGTDLDAWRDWWRKEGKRGAN